jgi:hypothetical protein
MVDVDANRRIRLIVDDIGGNVKLGELDISAYADPESRAHGAQQVRHGESLLVEPVAAS